MSLSVNQSGDDVEVDHMHVIEDDTAPLVMPDGAVDHTRFDCCHAFSTHCCASIHDFAFLFGLADRRWTPTRAI
jgi:hypothetical protein